MGPLHALQFLPTSYKLRLPRSSRFSKAGDFCCGEVFLQEHFVLAVLYVQLRACPVGVYGRAFLDFRQMFSATKKSRVPRPSRVLCGRAGILTSCPSRRCLESGDSPRRGLRADSAERKEFKIPAPSASSGQALSQKPRQGRGTRFPLATGWASRQSRFVAYHISLRYDETLPESFVRMVLTFTVCHKRSA
jgi:hypothetical protein